MAMANKKKKISRTTPASKPAKTEASWPWIALLGGLLALVAIMVVVSVLPKPSGSSTDSTTNPTDGTGITAPIVDDSETTTMRIVKPSSADYITVEIDSHIENDSTILPVKLSIVYENGQWLLDTPTY